MIEAAYDILHVERNASPHEVRQAYVRMVRRYPPEHFPEKFARLRKAYQQLTLSDDFVLEMLRRISDSDSSLELAACLWGDRKELAYDQRLVPEELMSLVDKDDARHDLYSLLTSVPDDEIEWKIGGGV